MHVCVLIIQNELFYRTFKGFKDFPKKREFMEKQIAVSGKIGKIGGKKLDLIVQ